MERHSAPQHLRRVAPSEGNRLGVDESRQVDEMNAVEQMNLVEGEGETVLSSKELVWRSPLTTNRRKLGRTKPN